MILKAMFWQLMDRDNRIRIPHPLPKKHQPLSWLVLFYIVGIRTDQMRYAGGISLPPVRKLAASLIFARLCG